MSNGPKRTTVYINSKGERTDVKTKWWREPEEDQYRHIAAVVSTIEQNQTYRRYQNIKFAKLYSNYENPGNFISSLFARTVDSFLSNRLTLNVVKSCIDTATSKIAKNKPRPLFLTSDGDWTLQQKAKKLTRYMDGLFEETDVYTVAQQVFRDACVFGLGALKIFIDPADKKIRVDRVLNEELIIDDAEGLYQKPSQIHQKKLIFRDYLIEAYPEKEQEIRAAQAGVTGDIGSHTAADQIVALESWHLPSSKGAGDGRHVISINGATLFSEAYDKDYFPIIVFRWSDRLVGFFGVGLAEELIGIQIELTKLLRNIQQAQHLMAVPKFLVESTSLISTAHLNNEIGGIIKYTGNPPQAVTAPAMNAEIYQWVENLYRKAYEITGISQLSANSTKPAGLNSGVALREYQDIETERFIITGQRYEAFIMQIAKIFIDLSRDLYSISKKATNVKAKGGNGQRRFIESINWKDVDLDNDEYSMQVFPVSLLPQTPAGRLQTVQELVQAGFIGKDQALSLLDFPDVDRFISLQTAALDDVHMLIDNMIEKGSYVSPEPFMNLQLALTETQSAYLRGKCNQVSEDRLDLLRRFMDDVQTLLEPPPQQAPPAMAPDGGMQGLARPDRPPRADLLPFNGATPANGAVG